MAEIINVVHIQYCLFDINSVTDQELQTSWVTEVCGLSSLMLQDLFYVLKLLHWLHIQHEKRLLTFIIVTH